MVLIISSAMFLQAQIVRLCGSLKNKYGPFDYIQNLEPGEGLRLVETGISILMVLILKEV